jgi:acetylornithine deacetylase
VKTEINIEGRVCAYVEEQRDRLVQIIQDLIRIPSENQAPVGAEEACQQYVAEFLRREGCDTETYPLDEVVGLKEHPLYWPGRDYSKRPNVGARKKGQGGGRSLLLSGHIDTVPRGTQPWTHDPFGGEVEGNRLYGRGSNDMKGGVGTNLFIVESLNRLALELEGDLVVETVVDEEFGGVNGTLAGRLKGYNADAAILSEPSLLRICPAQRGGRTIHITFNAPGGVLTEGKFPSGVIDQLSYFLSKIPSFAEHRRQSVKLHELYAHHIDPVPVAITKVFTAPWGTSEPISTPESCKIEMYWQTMPGEKQADVELEFFEWLDGILAEAPRLFPARPTVEFPIRWLPGSSISLSDPLVRELAVCARHALGKEVPVVGLEGPCDMYIFHQESGMPAVLWGASGGNTHAADEYLDIDSVVSAAKTLLLFVCRWCGVADDASEACGLGHSPSSWKP